MDPYNFHITVYLSFLMTLQMVTQISKLMTNPKLEFIWNVVYTCSSTSKTLLDLNFPLDKKYHPYL